MIIQANKGNKSLDYEWGWKAGAVSGDFQKVGYTGRGGPPSKAKGRLTFSTVCWGR